MQLTYCLLHFYFRLHVTFKIHAGNKSIYFLVSIDIACSLLSLLLIFWFEISELTNVPCKILNLKIILLSCPLGFWNHNSFTRLQTENYLNTNKQARSPPTFLCSKKKKGRQREKRKGFKAETIKRLSPRSKYYCFSHSRASRIWKFFL